jgi:hypothetical protein
MRSQVIQREHTPSLRGEGGNLPGNLASIEVLGTALGNSLERPCQVGIAPDLPNLRNMPTWCKDRLKATVLLSLQMVVRLLDAPPPVPEHQR